MRCQRERLTSYRYFLFGNFTVTFSKKVTSYRYTDYSYSKKLQLLVTKLLTALNMDGASFLSITVTSNNEI